MIDFINKVIQGDCLEVMKDIPDKSIDLIVTDPPYGIGIAKRTNISIKGASDKTNEFKEMKWDSFIPTKEYFDEIIRISKNQIIWGGELFCSLITSNFMLFSLVEKGWIATRNFC